MVDRFGPGAGWAQNGDWPATDLVAGEAMARRTEQASATGWLVYISGEGSDPDSECLLSLGGGTGSIAAPESSLANVLHPRDGAVIWSPWPYFGFRVECPGTSVGTFTSRVSARACPTDFSPRFRSTPLYAIDSGTIPPSTSTRTPPAGARRYRVVYPGLVAGNKVSNGQTRGTSKANDGTFVVGDLTLGQRSVMPWTDLAPGDEVEINNGGVGNIDFRIYYECALW